jgi:hypothetical protein
MTPRRYKLAIGRFPYGGAGATTSEIAEVGTFLFQFGAKLARFDRIDPSVAMFTYADTPITYTRNRTIMDAHRAGADLLLMLDSDNAPDLYFNVEPGVPRFFDTAFDILDKHFDKGPCILYAPYCGPPPHPIEGGEEVPFVFKWHTTKSGPGNRFGKLMLMSREEAAVRGGYEQVPAGATGCMLIDMRVFNFTNAPNEKLVNPPWFDYEWGDPPFNTKKATTEDVFFTRNATMAGIPVYVLWDCWAGHSKPEMVGKPLLIHSDTVNSMYREAVLRGVRTGEKEIQLSPESTAEEIGHDGNGDGKAQDGNGFLNGVGFLTDDVGFKHVGMTKSEEDTEAIREIVSDLVNCDGFPSHLNIVEIGSWVGDSAKTIVGQLRPDDVLYCVDTWEGSPSDATYEYVRKFGGSQKVFEVFHRNMKQWIESGQLEVVRGDSIAVAKMFREEGNLFDMVFIDADHATCDQDILAWQELVRPGGVLCGHDYNPEVFPAVVKAVDNLLGPVQVKGTVWAWNKPVEGNHESACKAETQQQTTETEPPWPGRPMFLDGVTQ